MTALALALVLVPGWESVTFSVYASRFGGRRAADGSRYDHHGLTAASNRHRLGTVLECRYKGRSVRVVVTDRTAPRFKHRVDLSGGAFKALHSAYRFTDASGTLLKGEFREVAR